MRPRKYCSVTNCKNNSNVTGVRFFKFPKDLKLKDAWIQFVDKQEWQPKTNSFICSAHFPAHHITAKGHLKKGSIPTSNNQHETLLSGTGCSKIPA